MADITAELEISQEWTEITVPLGMRSGSTYLLDIASIQIKATIFSADTDDGATPPTVSGHPWRNETGAAIDQREVTPASGTFTWLRVDRNSATVVSTVA